MRGLGRDELFVSGPFFFHLILLYFLFHLVLLGMEVTGFERVKGFLQPADCSVRDSTFGISDENFLSMLSTHLWYLRGQWEHRRSCGELSALLSIRLLKFQRRR